MDSVGGGPGISQPWSRARAIMSSVGVQPIGTTTFYNYGRYKNDNADQLIAQIALTDDKTQLKDLWTQLNKLYLTDIPTVPLMYRPGEFYAVNSSVWQGFPVQGDGTNIPPQICIDGSGIKALYNITAKK